MVFCTHAARRTSHARLCEQPLQPISTIAIAIVEIRVLFCIRLVPLERVHIARLLWLLVLSVLHGVVDVAQQRIDGVFRCRVEWEEVDQRKVGDELDEVVVESVEFRVRRRVCFLCEQQRVRVEVPKKGKQREFSEI